MTARRRVSATWDEGWVGKSVHSPGFCDDRNKETMQVPDTGDDKPFLFVEMDGQRYACYKRRPIGFVE